MTDDNKRKRILKGKHKDLIFYTLMMIWPIGQFLVFYIGANGNAILLTFQRIDIVSGTVTWTLDNLKTAFTNMTGDLSMLIMFRNSVLLYVIGVLFTSPLSLLFSYYIYKKAPGADAFRVLLFVPSMIASIVFVAMFKFFVERALPTVINKMFGTEMIGLLENPDTRFGTLLFFSIWSGFGGGVLMYSNTMSGISQEIVESAHLDGATGLKEFIHITFPMIFPTYTTFFVTGIAGIFSNSFGLFSFYGANAPEEISTYGYYLYMRTQGASSRSEYSYISAMGLCMTAVVVPLTFLARYLLERFGPSEDTRYSRKSREGENV